MKNPPWWSHKYGSDKICGISLVRIRPGKNKDGYPHSIILTCGHCFYRKALIEWFVNCDTPTCPLCRCPFEPSVCFLK
jgi:hypothetical protein